MKRLVGILTAGLILITAFSGCKSTDSSLTSSDIIITSQDAIATDSTVTSSNEEAVSKPVENSTQDTSSKDKTIDSSSTPEETKEPEKIVNENDDIGDLSLETVKKIKKLYLNELIANGDDYANFKNICISKYYGTLSDGSIIIKLDRLGLYYPAVVTVQPTMVIVNDYLYYAGAEPSVFKNNKLESLKIAYENGTITTKVLDELFSKNPNLNLSEQYFNKNDNCGSLDKLDVCSIKQSYRYILGISNYKLSDLVIKDYYGNLKDNMEIIVLGIEKSTSKEVTEELGKYKYTHPENQGLYVYRRGTHPYSTSITEIGNVNLYNNQITDKELDEIAKNFPQYFKVVDNK